MIGKRKWAIVVVILLMMTGMQGLVWAEDVTVYLQAVDTQMSVGTTQDVVLVFENVNQAEIVSFDGLDAFDVMSKSQSSSTSIVNGSRKMQYRVNYTLMPKKEGTYNLSATVKADGKTYTTNVLTLTVSEQSTPANDSTEDVFVDTKVSRESSYAGEKIVLTYDVYSMYNVSGFDTTEPISIDGVLMEDVSPDTPSPQYLTLNNNQYVKYQAKQYVLTPTGTGDIEIPSFNFQVNLSTGGFFNETKPVYAATKPITLHVMPLPSEGRPADFTGLVGNLKMEGRYDTDTVAYGDPITLELTVSGEGNVDSLGTLLTEQSVPGFSVYETQKDPDVSYSESGYQISKTYETILVPKSGGSLDIPPVNISYFNTETDAYDVLTMKEQAINVTGGPVNEGDPSTTETAGMNNQTADLTLATPVVITQITYPGQREWSTPVMAGIFLGLLLLAGIGYGVYRWRGKDEGQIPTTVKGIKKQLAREKDSEQRYALFIRYMESVYGIRIQQESMEHIQDKVRDSKQAEALNRLINYMEHERYYEKRKDAEVLEWMYEGV